jgi:S-adenosylmethionine:tRNA ribosyltransferase-isomerase
MRVDLFDFELPTDRIALRPARPRDSARLLFASGEEISDRQMLDLPALLTPGDVLVFNDTKVIPAQLEGTRGAARIGATLHKREGPRSWWSLVRNARRVKIGERIEFGDGVSACATERGADGALLLHFDGDERPMPRTWPITRPCSRARRERWRHRPRRCISRRGCWTLWTSAGSGARR